MPEDPHIPPRREIAQFLAHHGADSMTMDCRIRGIRSIEEARKMIEIEADHQRRKEVIGKVNQRIEELREEEAEEVVA